MKKVFVFLFLASVSLSSAQDLTKKDAPEFIVEMADARLMDREEGRLAASLGTTREIRDYGSLMVKDQDFLHSELEKLARSKDITLPNAISEKKSKALKKLSTLTGKEFDRKFLKMIKTDHKRDVKRFKKAMKFDDADTREFATKYLPMIQSHLDGVQNLIKKARN